MAEIESPTDYIATISGVTACLDAISKWQATNGIKTEQQFFSAVWFRGNGRVHPIPLRPGVYRDEFKKIAEHMHGKDLETKRLNTELRMLDEFRAAGAGFLNSADAVDVYFTAQHYGMPTRLLDWTTNPLAALFFAVENKHLHGENGELFVMDANKVLPDDSGAKYKIWGIVGIRNPYTAAAIGESFWIWHKRQPLVIPVLPDNRPGRIGQQNSRFTLHMHNAPPAQNKTLAKMKIPADSKPRILEDLHRLNVNEFTTYNDLDHLSKGIRRAWGID